MVLPTEGNTAGTFCILEHKRMSDVCEQYLVRSKSTAENQYVSLRSKVSYRSVSGLTGTGSSR